MSNKWLKVVFLLMTYAPLMIGCSSKNTANKDNFKKAITEWQQQYGGYLAGTKTLPTTLQADRAPKLIVRNFAMLSAAGLVSVVLDKNAKDSSTGAVQPQYKYSLTELGKKSYVPEKGFKTSVPQLTEIVDFTPPADGNGGKKTTTVRYKYKDVPSDLGKIINKNAKEEIYDGAIQLELTDKGWKASSNAN